MFLTVLGAQTNLPDDDNDDDDDDSFIYCIKYRWQNAAVNKCEEK